MVTVHGPVPAAETRWPKVEEEVEELRCQGEKLENSAESRKLGVKQGQAEGRVYLVDELMGSDRDVGRSLCAVGFHATGCGWASRVSPPK